MGGVIKKMIEYYLDLIENGPRRTLCRECLPRIGEALYDFGNSQKYVVIEVQHNIDSRVESRERGLPLVVATPLRDITKDKI